MSTETKSQSPTEAVYYYHNDHLGTPLKMTDEDGDVAWDGVYKPFGELFSTPVADIQNNFRFPGQYDDLITGLYYNHNRYYIPSLGRYNRVDPVVSGNPYIYALNNPIDFIDLDGLKECKELGKEVTRLTFYTDIGDTKSGYPAGPEGVAVNSCLYKLKWKSKAKLNAQGCKWNEFDIPFAGHRIALDTGSKVSDNIDVWFSTIAEGRSFERKLNPSLRPDGAYGIVTIFECQDCYCQ